MRSSDPWNPYETGNPLRFVPCLQKIFDNDNSKVEVDFSLEENLDLEEAEVYAHSIIKNLNNSEKLARKYRKFEAVYRKTKDSRDVKHLLSRFLYSNI